jgi:ATP-dependent protease HslVU (ClpYQ) peptidase subunit
MTTIVAVKKNGTVAIAADSLTTFGDTRLGRQYKGEHDKIIEIGGSYIGLCGSSAHHLVLSALLPKLEDVASAAAWKCMRPSAACTPCSRSRATSTRRRTRTIPTSPRRSPR